ncbi:vanillate/3-O-methylgallate O-demethylase [Ochrobactrum intermedium]|uniref:Vanillate/3-O-methylgallate O-demethylase n=1 Tax=Brucella intermedia TaxID=94625 RepID=A0ABR6AVI6_9HYPH|nr:aminomethyl transferase family protein [Brucella intermedia]MBA8853477.1 vanillate/3-O-methylgallate O-demethylase [Brucella intermedia]
MSDVSKYRTGLDIANSWGRLEYTGWMDEGLSWKTDCYIGDWTYLDEIRVKGPDALKLFSDLAVNSFEKFALGQAKHVIFCNKDGKVIGEGILMRHGEDDYEYNGRGPATTWIEYNFKKGGYQSDFSIKISEFKFQVSGPKSIYLLEKLTGESLRDIGFMRFRNSRINGHELSFLRQGMAGEIGFEIHGPGELAKEVMDAVMTAGQEFNIRRMGARTAMVNHLEAGFPTVTHDYIPAITGPAEKDYFDTYNIKVTDQTSPEWFQSFERCLKVKGSFEGDDLSAWFRSPVELGWTRNIKFDHNFYGREALEKEVANPKRGIVSLIWNVDDVKDVYNSLFEEGEAYDFMDMPRQQWFAMYASKVMDGDKLVGSTTSRGYSYYFRKVLSHGVIDVEYMKPGTELTVVWGDPGHRQKLVRVTVGPYPYKQDNRRTDLASIA